MHMQNRYRLTDIENPLVVTEGESEEGKGNTGVGEEEIQTTMYKIDKQQGHIL